MPLFLTSLWVPFSSHFICAVEIDIVTRRLVLCQVMLLAFVLLGRTLEGRARVQASSDMQDLLVSGLAATFFFGGTENLVGS